MNEIPLRRELVQGIVNYMTAGSTPLCTWQQLNAMVLEIMDAAKAADAQLEGVALTEPKANGAAQQHGNG